jgi:hypothetical protein
VDALELMNTFLIADKILFQPTIDWLAGQSSSLRLESEDQGILVYQGEDTRLVLVHPIQFSLAQLSTVLRAAMADSRELQVIAPGMIEYFASGMTRDDEIFGAINTLSAYVVGVLDAPVFRMMHKRDADGVAALKHIVTFGSFPRDFGTVRCDYVDRNGRIVPLDQIALPAEVKPVSVPLIFYHSGLAHQTFGPGNVVIPEKWEKYGFERMAFDELLIRFPSRENPWPEEYAALMARFALDRKTLLEIWKHNRDQWDLVREKMKIFGKPIPGPVTKESGDPAFNQFSHLVMSGFLKIASRLDVSIPQIRHIGLPLFARNGVTIPLGTEGIIKLRKNFTDQTLAQRVQSLLPGALAARFSVDSREKVAGKIVTPA